MKTKTVKNNINILYEFVRKSIKSQYRNSWLGMLWTILNPLLNMLIMWVIFQEFFGKGDPYYALYLFCGNILFSFLKSSTTTSLTSIVNNRTLLTKIKLKKSLFPLSNNIASFVSFLFSYITLFIIMGIICIVNKTNIFSYQILYTLVIFPAFMLFQYGISLFLSALYVFCRDIKHLYSVFLTLWTYITPIFYKVNTLSTDSFGYKIIKLNPIYYFVTLFRDCVYGLTINNQVLPNLLYFGLIYIFGVVSYLIGKITFISSEKRFMIYV